MKNWIPLAALLSALLLMTPSFLEAAYPAQFRGVCQQCGRDLVAYYRPVLCTSGETDWQWVPERHQHCRPAYEGKQKFDFFHSYLMNPANPKWRDRHAPVSQDSCCD
ncbi:MAG: hypothetical protein KA152_07600 [Verrucomicrobiales bacterium]|jgi:hypothetical protein|nr:hypothetical protein [Verrucomicrobiales bacterium]HQW29331.1 hypothetical protein [Verrucomicrobiales bacterium]